MRILRAKEAGGKHGGVVEEEGVALLEIVHHVAEVQPLVGVVAVGIFLKHVYLLALAVHHHQLAAVALIDALHRSVFVFKDFVGRIKGYLLLGQFEFEL